MHEFKPFDRVGATLFSSDTTYSYILGYGIYTGEWIDPSEVECTRDELLKPLGPSVAERNKNPLIMLDNGDIVWGRECFWMSQQDFERAESEHGIKHEIVRIGPHREKSFIRQGKINYDSQCKPDNFTTDLSEPVILN